MVTVTVCTTVPPWRSRTVTSHLLVSTGRPPPAVPLPSARRFRSEARAVGVGQIDVAERDQPAVAQRPALARLDLLGHRTGHVIARRGRLDHRLVVGPGDGHRHRLHHRASVALADGHVTSLGVYRPPPAGSALALREALPV